MSNIRTRRENAIKTVAAGSQQPELSQQIPILDDDTPVLGLIDLDRVEGALEELHTAFVSDSQTLHAVACKAVPLAPILRLYAEAGAGCEVASPGELALAQAAGFPANRIVFDSPAKTQNELKTAIELGLSLNVDNWQELNRIDELLGYQTQRAEGVGEAASTATATAAETSAMIGVRVNPQTGTGSIDALSTATRTSKFGVGLIDPGEREKLVAAYAARPWLKQIHVHSGSQGLSMEHAAQGIASAVDLARDINDHIAAHGGARRQVTRIDIGGGLSVNFGGEEVTPTFADYRAVLDREVPGLFDFDIVTEFGRSLLAKAGAILTRVEYTKTTGGRHIAMTHAGAQVATRTAYAPEDWPLRILPFDPRGRLKSGDEVVTDVAGPACFSGDLLARDRMLPRLDAGDLVAVPDTGAYYFSNPFSYNLLPRVPVYGYRARSGESTGSTDLEFVLIRRGQSLEEILVEAGEGDLEPLGSVAREVSEN